MSLAAAMRMGDGRSPEGPNNVVSVQETHTVHHKWQMGGVCSQDDTGLRGF